MEKLNHYSLMVGDWVRIIDDDTDAYFDARVEGIDVLANIYAAMPCDKTAYPYSVDCAKPIPLTPEILEKNGFIYKDAAHNNFRGVWVCNVGRCNNVFIQFTDKVAIEIHNELGRKDEKGRADLVSFCRDWCEVLFVHELQHALRLCGIDKTIEL